jgi:hypothetical protein
VVGEDGGQKIIIFKKSRIRRKVEGVERET